MIDIARPITLLLKKAKWNMPGGHKVNKFFERSRTDENIKDKFSVQVYGLGTEMLQDGVHQGNLVYLQFPN